MKRVLLKCGLTLLAAHLLLFWLLNYVPGYFPVFGTREINVQITYPDLSEPAHVVDYFGSILAASIVAGAISFYIAGRLKGNSAARIISVLLWIGLGVAYRYLHASRIL